jgi:hypothetical protein
MSVATLNTKATGVVLTPEEELTFTDIMEAGLTPAPNTSVDLSGFDPVLVMPIEQYIDEANDTVAAAAKTSYESITWVGKGTMVEVTYHYPPSGSMDSYKAWCEQTEEAFREQRAMIVAKYLELDYTPLDADFKAVFVERLRAQGDRQCRGSRRMGEKVCAMGLADEIAGGTGYHLTRAGFTGIASDAIIAFNDIADWTFAKIADWVERKL